MKLNEMIILLSKNKVEFTFYTESTIEIVITKSVFDVEIDRYYHLHFEDDELIEILSSTWVDGDFQVTEKILTFDEFVKELNLKDYTSKEIIIQSLIDEGIDFEDYGDELAVIADDGIIFTEYRMRFDESEKLYSVRIYEFDYETESILRNEEIVFDQMIDEISRYIS